jgi:hypothetical protein
MPLNARLTSPPPAPPPGNDTLAGVPGANSRPPAPRPLLLVDIDGVVSLFGFPPHAPPAGAFHWIDGIPHFLSATAAAHLLALAVRFELVWCSGWEERADEYLPALLGVPRALPFLRFGDAVRSRGPRDDAGAYHGGANDGDAHEHPDASRITRGHWKLAAIDAFAGVRPLAWIDDCLDEPCREWAAARGAPTLLVQTDAAVGITAGHVRTLLEWAFSQTHRPPR